MSEAFRRLGEAMVPQEIPEAYQGRSMRSWRCPSTKEERITFIGHSVEVYATHWLESEVPCLRNWNLPCELCQLTGGPPRYTGWIVGVRQHERNMRKVAIPEGAMLNCPQLRERKGKLRGEVFAFRRLTAKAQAPVEVRWVETYGRQLPEAPPLQPHLLRMWQVERLMHSHPAYYALRAILCPEEPPGGPAVPFLHGPPGEVL